MTTSNANLDKLVSRRVKESAERLKRHIRSSQLRPGDRYLKPEDAGRMLGESVTTVQRAMALLAEHNILERRRKAGTFIGEAAVAAKAQPLQCVHVLLPEVCSGEIWAYQSVLQQIEGMRLTLPGVSIRFDFMPKDQVSFAQQVVEQFGDDLIGVVLILSSRELRAFFNESAVPTVVMGGSEANFENLCWIYLNQTETGQKLTDYLLDRGHRKIATVMREVWSFGEHEIHDSIAKTLSKHGLEADSLMIRSAPVEAGIVRDLAKKLFLEPNPPTGFICRTDLQAEWIRQVAEEIGMLKKIDITACSITGLIGKPRFVCTVCDTPPKERGQDLGRMLSGMASNNPPKNRNRTFSVKLFDPSDLSAQVDTWS